MYAGLAPGTYQFEASIADRNLDPIATTTLSVDLTATAHADGTLYTLVNSSGVAGNTLDASALPTRLNDPRSVATGADGSVYVADRANHRVLRVDPDGVMTKLIGGGSGTLPTSGMLAVDQSVPNPSGVGTSGGSVFISSSSTTANRGYVFEIDAGGVLRWRAGGGSLSGDNLAGTDVTLLGTADLLSVGDRVYFGESTRLRYLDSNFNIFSVSIDPTNGACDLQGAIAELAALDATRLAVSGYYTSCVGVGGMSILDVNTTTGETFDLDDGYALITFAATEIDAFAVSPVSGDFYFATIDQIIRKESGGSFTPIAGTDGVQGRDLSPVLVSNGALIDDPINMAFLPNGDLVIAESGNVVRVLTQPDSL
jgi:hypothetical protein